VLAALTIVGCGNEYRPVVSAINPVGPAGQPAKYAVAVSSPSSTSAGLVTYVDFAGDTVLSTPNVLANPSYFAITQTASQGFVINSAGSLDNFGLGNPTAVLTSTIGQTTLAANSDPVTISAVQPYGSTETLFIPEAASSKIAILNASGAPSLLQELAVDPNPVYVVGADGAPRVYALSEGSTPGGNGTIASIEALSSTALAVSATIPVGIAPVYGVMTTDDRRAFVLNQGSGTVSVVNVINNALDSTTPTITIPPISTGGGATTAPRPIWADLSTVNNELVVLNQGDGIHPGTLSIINIPLCSAATQPSNPNCDSANPVDATGFGTFLPTATVGINPTMVSVLHDGTEAYVINGGNAASSECNGQGSVSVVSLSSGQVTKTICAVASGTTNDGYIHGHPNSVSATTGNPTGKVYVTASDSTDLSVIYTDTNTVQTHITLQGLGVRVLVTSP
jgi:DNA-binding beta-propeller fold protein YncE